MLKAHHDAAKARAREHPLLAGAEISDVVRITRGGVPVRANYLVLTTNLPGYTGDRLTAPHDVSGDYLLEQRWRVVAVDLDGMYELMDALRAQFVGHRLAVEGRAVSPFTSELDEPDRDRDADVVFQDLYLDAKTSRAI
jgi:hypothetical protein